MSSTIPWNQIACPRLLVIGDLMLDRYVWGEAERVSPEAPVLVLREDLDEVRPGGAANVASFLHGLDADVVLAGVVGNDAEGRTLRRLIADLAVDATCVITDPERQTTTKQRFVGRANRRQPHQILRVDRESRQSLSLELENDLVHRIVSTLPDCDAVLVSDYAKGVCTELLLRTVIDTARRYRIPILVDPCRVPDYSRYRQATVISPNRAAAELVLGRKLADSSGVCDAAVELRCRDDVDAVVITLDRDGLAYATAHETGVVPCRPRDVCDVTGAGDMVLSILGLCLASGISLVDSLPIANAAAGLEVERFGVEPVTREEITSELESNSAPRCKLQSLDAVARATVEARRAGQTVVFTNGCFDLLHVGHVSLLEEASRLGDVLIVAINSDASVRKLKGAERPIIGQDDRARMLGALACVDHVLIFDDDAPHRLLEAIRPDVLVKGGTTGHIVGREIVEAYGGRIVQTPAVTGISTTKLVERIRPEDGHSCPSGLRLLDPQKQRLHDR